jgi:hypothetical protein
MRHSLVILYFAAIYYILRPAPPPEIQATTTAEPPARPEASRPVTVVAAPQQPKRTWEPPTRALPVAPVFPTVAYQSPQSPPQQNVSETLQTVETASEQRNASPASPTVQQGPVAQEGPVEQLLQRELVRLSCLIGKPDNVWGRKSRAAMRRFARRAKAGDTSLDVAMLRMMRSYPAGYCKSCKPGENACDIGATASTTKRAVDVAAQPASPPSSPAEPVAVTAQPAPPAPVEDKEETPATALSYLPPWMNEAKAGSAEGDFSEDTETVTRKPKKKRKVQRRRPSRSVNTMRRRYDYPSSYYRGGGGWPFAY